MFQKIKTKLKASALVVTMIILGIILVSTLSISLVAVQERKASLGEDSSNKAYNKAEDGVEIVMKAITRGGLGNVSEIEGYLTNVTCDANGLLIGADGFSVELKDANEAKISCNDSALISSVKSIKSVGKIGDNQRAVQVAVARTGVDNGCIICDIPHNTNKVCLMIEDGENICADGDGCSLNYLRVDQRAGFNNQITILSNGFYYQHSNGQWGVMGANGAYGINGGSGTKEMVYTTEIYDDSGDSTESSEDALYVTNQGGINTKLILCDE